MAATSTRGAFAASFENKRLWLIQFFANPVLILLYAAWLLIPEARTWELILNVVLGIAIVVPAVVLHAGTLSYFCGRFRNEGTLLKPAFARALRNIIAVAVWMVVFYLIWRAVGKARSISGFDDHLFSIDAAGFSAPAPHVARGNPNL